MVKITNTATITGNDARKGDLTGDNIVDKITFAGKSKSLIRIRLQQIKDDLRLI